MLRMAPYKNNNLFRSGSKTDDGYAGRGRWAMANKFYPLKVEISNINSLALSWTIVHAIDEKKPLLYGFSKEDIKNAKLEVLVFVKAFDEVFSNTVVERTSYISEEIIWGAKFRLMYHPSHDNTKTILDIARLK